jgi:hypothetical protein
LDSGDINNAVAIQNSKLVHDDQTIAIAIRTENKSSNNSTENLFTSNETNHPRSRNTPDPAPNKHSFLETTDLVRKKKIEIKGKRNDRESQKKTVQVKMKRLMRRRCKEGGEGEGEVAKMYGDEEDADEEKMQRRWWRRW